MSLSQSVCDQYVSQWIQQSIDQSIKPAAILYSLLLIKRTNLLLLEIRLGVRVMQCTFKNYKMRPELKGYFMDIVSTSPVLCKFKLLFLITCNSKWYIPRGHGSFGHEFMIWTWTLFQRIQEYTKQGFKCKLFVSLYIQVVYENRPILLRKKVC